MAGLLTMAPPMAPTSSDGPQSTSGSSGGRHMKLPTSSSLLFGFLISFLALFIVFMGCGLTSRYMVDRRRQRVVTTSDLRGGVVKPPVPRMWDVRTVPGKESWKELTPLSVEVRKETSDEPPTSEPIIRRERTPAEELMHAYHEMRSRGARLLSFPRRTPSQSATPSSQASRPRTMDDGVDLQIAVLVAMPSPSRRKSMSTSIQKDKGSTEEDAEDAGEAECLPDVALGTARIPWDKHELSFG